MVRTKKLRIPPKHIYSEINATSADVWNNCLVLMDFYQYQRGYPHAHNRFYFGKDCPQWMQKKLAKRFPLHSHSVLAVMKRYFAAWRSYSTHKRNGNTDARPPHKRKSFMTTRWNYTAIRFDKTLLGNSLSLAMGSGRKRFDILLPNSFDMSCADNMATVDLVHEYGEWTLNFTYRFDDEPTDETGDGVLAVDIGEIHPMVTHDGEETLIFNGRYIRSLYQLRNKGTAGFQRLLSRTTRFSRRYRKLVQRKWKTLNRLERQIADCLHKATAKLRDVCVRQGIGTVVVGDLKGIRKRMDYGKKANQKLHQWAFGRIAWLLDYKLKAVGIMVVSQDEAYTSQTCPACSHRYKPRNRNYHCKECGFTFHRDGVGAINIRKKYLGQVVPVAAAMIPPRGIRQTPRLTQCVSQTR